MEENSLPSKLENTSVERTRADHAEILSRVKEVEQLLLEGYTRAEFLPDLMEKWDVAPRTIDTYIKTARDNIKEINRQSLEENLAFVHRGLVGVYRDAKKVADLAEQRQSLMSIARIRGLEQHTINHVVRDDRELQDASDEMLNDILDAEFEVKK